jgi:hypothetical protein
MSELGGWLGVALDAGSRNPAFAALLRAAVGGGAGSSSSGSGSGSGAGAGAGLYGIDVGESGGPASLALGGLHPAWAGAVQWSTRLASPSPCSYCFQVYAPALCGLDLLDALGLGAGSWPAIVDTGATCLGLPNELRDSLVAWVPGACC